ncbi:MAG TPA: hypothetical protein VHO71_04595 [Caproiciproducens sp.]|nr:hypothetical protein [Caproiciproducens sp.]
MDQKAKEFINGVGATAEACMVFYKSSVAQGFASEQAFELTKVFLTAMIAGPRSRSNDEG